MMMFLSKKYTLSKFFDKHFSFIVDQQFSNKYYSSITLLRKKPNQLWLTLYFGLVHRSPASTSTPSPATITTYHSKHTLIRTGNSCNALLEYKTI